MNTNKSTLEKTHDAAVISAYEIYQKSLDAAWESASEVIYSH